MAYSIGEGVRNAIEAAGDEPRSDEIYENSPGNPAVSHTYGRDAIYVYYGEDNRVQRLPFEVP